MAIFLLILLSVGLYSCCSKASDIKYNGNQITIDAGQFHVVMEKRAEYSDNYLVVGGSNGSTMYFDAILSLIPMTKAEEMTVEYGDFMQCSNPGAEEAKQAVINFIIIAADAQIKNTINNVINIIETGISSGKPRRPIIKISAAKLNMLKFTTITNSIETPVESDMNSMPHLLVKDIEIIKEDEIKN